MANFYRKKSNLHELLFKTQLYVAYLYKNTNYFHRIFNLLSYSLFAKRVN